MSKQMNLIYIVADILIGKNFLEIRHDILKERKWPDQEKKKKIFTGWTTENNRCV